MRVERRAGFGQAEAARGALTALGYPVDWRSYAMGHEVCMDEVADLNAWLVQRLVA